MLMTFPLELKDKIAYIDGKLTAIKELTEEEQALFDDIVQKENDVESDMFEEE
ncbi:MAG: hypothetical protein PHN80_06145 [Hespellia sp.]|nr:hypothetical protein [Hespellia sp.]